MAKRKIRHALVQYTVTEGGNTRFETAFRNQVVDIPKDQVERLDALGATVEPDADLARPGRMSVLPDTASDSEITSWVIGASIDEVEALKKERPVLASRIEAAQASVKKRFEEQDQHLAGSRREIAEEESAEEPEDSAEEEESDEDDLIGGPLSEAEADRIVDGDYKSVVDYISENPRSAGLILEAEGRRAEAAKGTIRVSVVKAVEAAAGFTQ